MMNAVGLFADGSARGRGWRRRGRQSQAAGWGFARFRAAEPNGRDKPRPQLGARGIAQCGPRVPQYVGARHFAPNVGEISAGAEALLWLLAQRESEGALVASDSRARVIAGFTRAPCLFQEVFQPKENVELAALAVHQWTRAGQFSDARVRGV